MADDLADDPADDLKDDLADDLADHPAAHLADDPAHDVAGETEDDRAEEVVTDLADPAAADGAERSRLALLVDGLTGPAPALTPFGVYVVGAADPASGLGRRLERRVFAEVFGNSPQLLADEYGPYEPASLFVLVVDHARKLPAGVIRLIIPSRRGLKSLEDIRRIWGRDPVKLVRSTGLVGDAPLVWDVATLAIDPEYRRGASQGLVSLALWQAVAGLAYRCEVDLLVAIIDVAVHRLIGLKLQKPFVGFEGLAARGYLDSDASLPVWSRPAQWKDRMTRADPALCRLMVRGEGLEPAVTPLNWDAALNLLRATGISASQLPLQPDLLGQVSVPA